MEYRGSGSLPELHPPGRGIRAHLTLTCKMPLPAVSDTIEEARYQARQSGRTHVAAIDLRNALLDFRIPSDAALQRAFESPEKRRFASPNREVHVGTAHLQQRCNGIANVMR